MSSGGLVFVELLTKALVLGLTVLQTMVVFGHVIFEFVNLSLGPINAHSVGVIFTLSDILGEMSPPMFSLQVNKDR